ncbi:MAG: pyruvate formate lyase-activating protein [Clostridia bacterium]|nr:pyruvate formate lyase-activating protein [Clostridia bacterium]
MTGRVHSIQTLGTLDGPGVRFVVFTQGCNLRCGCCHNPDTWDLLGGEIYMPEQILEKALRYRDYFGDKGGITFSGGEPLLQAQFVKEVFALCHDNGINTCLDTSGSVFNQAAKELLEQTDRVLLDIKYTNDEDYKRFVGCSLGCVENFLKYLDAKKINTTLRQVIIPTLNDSDSSILKLKEIANNHKCVDKIELLPFKKICKSKYDQMGIDFVFDKYSTPNSEIMNKLNSLLR